MKSYIEKGKNLFVYYIDFEKVFDRVWQQKKKKKKKKD